MMQNSMGRLSLAHRKEDAFIGTGFTKWKKALDRFREHEASECHSVALTYQEIQPKCKDIVTTFDEGTKATMKMNRKCFVKIIESLLYLGRQGIALRQSVDLESNFVQLLELRAIDVPELREWLDRPGRSDTYTSHDSQNEILSLAANSIVRDIVSDIKSGSCSWFALIADEYTDIANKEQLSICVRWIDNKLESHEDFLGFYEIPDIKSQTIDTILKDALIRLQLSLDQCRAQCYDGASNMLGKKSGVATRIQQVQPKAFATHCHCHSLSLSVKASTKGCDVLDNTMNTSKEVVTLIKYSPKREKILGAIKDNIEANNDDEDSTPGVAKFSMTRWTVRASCFSRIYTNYQALQDTWNECLDQGGLQSELRGRIVGAKAQMETFEFFFGIQLGNRLFSHTDNLSKTLQAKRICATEGHRIASQTVGVLKTLRTDDSFDAFWAATMKKKDLLHDVGR